jgi:predicted transposase YbfD/YdcC
LLPELLDAFSELDDPRCDYKVEHNLLDILVMTICAVIGCAESWEDIELYARSKEAWLREFLSLKNGIPSHDTFRRVFTLINPKQFERCFRGWIGQWLGGSHPDCVAIDGKTLRRSFDHKRKLSPIHLVSAWASKNRLTLGQVAVDSKSNEITAIPELLAELDLADSLVTIDAMGCQKDIAQTIVDKQAQYVLALKGNQKKTFQAVKGWFEREAFTKPWPLRPTHDAFDESHGRLQRRRVFVNPVPSELTILQEWPGISSIIAVESIRRVGFEDTRCDIRYFISSADPADTRIATAIRQHWSIENSLHWVLDVTFGEDNSRIRDRNATENMALLRKIAINLIQKSQTKGSVRGRRKKAAWDNDYMAKVLA